MESPSEQPERLVQFSPRAHVQLEDLIEQLRANWSAAVVTNFLSLLARRLHQVSLMPYSCPPSGRFSDQRQCLIGSRTLLHYQVTEERIEITAIHDTRADALPR